MSARQDRSAAQDMRKYYAFYKKTNFEYVSTSITGHTNRRPLNTINVSLIQYKLLRNVIR